MMAAEGGMSDDRSREEMVATVKAAIIAELQRQAPGIYWWDHDDEELFDGGPITMDEMQDDNGDIVELADKFDMDAVAAAAITALGLPRRAA